MERAMATLTIEHQDNITIVKVSGKVTFDDIADTIRTRYHEVKRHLIWDFTDGDATGISSDDFRMVLRLVKEHRPYYEDSKTAYISPFDINFGMTRMFSAYAEVTNMPYPYKAFHSFEEAAEWLNGGDHRERGL